MTAMSFGLLAQIVSIPSNGSIQFLRGREHHVQDLLLRVSLNPLKRVNSILTKFSSQSSFILFSSLNPLKRVNSILTRLFALKCGFRANKSQSPQAGQFNSYAVLHLVKLDPRTKVSIPSNGSIQFLRYNAKFLLSAL